MLTHSEGKKILTNEGETPILEQYSVVVNPITNVVEIRLTHNLYAELGGNMTVLMQLKLSYDKEKNLVARFIREIEFKEEGEEEPIFDSLMFINLVSYIKETLKFYSA